MTCIGETGKCLDKVPKALRWLLTSFWVCVGFGAPYYNLNKTKIIDWDIDLNDPDSHVNMSGGRNLANRMGNLLAETFVR